MYCVGRVIVIQQPQKVQFNTIKEVKVLFSVTVSSPCWVWVWGGDISVWFNEGGVEWPMMLWDASFRESDAHLFPFSLYLVPILEYSVYPYKNTDTHPPLLLGAVWSIGFLHLTLWWANGAAAELLPAAFSTSLPGFNQRL